jgi:hypothetical protein
MIFKGTNKNIKVFSLILSTLIDFLLNIFRPSSDVIIQNSNTQDAIYSSKSLNELISEINLSEK